MNSEVRDAAERLRQILNGMPPYATYGEAAPARQDELINRDKTELAIAYLAEHNADDDEPVTDEVFSVICGSSRVLIDRSDFLSLVCFGGQVSFNVSGHGRFFVPITTRGQLRKLLEVLGVGK